MFLALSREHFVVIEEIAVQVLPTTTESRLRWYRGTVTFPEKKTMSLSRRAQKWEEKKKTGQGPTR